MTFKDKVVVVTGSGNNIGRSIALNYARYGARVVVAEKNEITGRETVDLIYDEGGKAIFFQTDTCSETDVIQLMEKVIKCYHRIDILINTIAYIADKAQCQSDKYPCESEKSQNAVEVNQVCTMCSNSIKSISLCSNEVLKYMRPQKKGTIINLVSAKNSRSDSRQDDYKATKEEIVAMTQQLAFALRDDHIKVNSISPGLEKSICYKRLSKLEDLEDICFTSDYVEDIAKTCLYMTSEDNDCVNGSNIVIDDTCIRKLVYLVNRK